MSTVQLEVAVTLIAGVLAIAQPIPQVTRIRRTNSAAGVSSTTAWLGMVVNSAWGAYGLGRGLAPVAIVSITYAVGYAAIVVLLWKRGAVEGACLGIGAATTLAALTVATGWVALGTILAFTVGVQFLPQVRTAWTDTDLTALAPGMYLVAGLDGVVWGTYGLAVTDWPVVLYGVVMLTMAAAVITPWARWRRMTRPAPALTRSA